MTFSMETMEFHVKYYVEFSLKTFYVVIPRGQNWQKRDNFMQMLWDSM